MRMRWKKYRGIWIPVFVTMLVWLLMKFVFLFGYVPTASMEPTLKQGSYILGLQIYEEPQKGDIVIFRHDGKLLVKRIAAVGGERILHNGTECVVPEGCYYMRGDNAEHSLDSRYWDEPFVEKGAIQAVLLLPIRE